MSSATKRILCNHIVYALQITMRILKMLPCFNSIDIDDLYIYLEVL